MLSREENELLTQVGPGTPMGNLLRRFWMPVLTSAELPENDGAPVRIRLLGEDLVAFRDTEGRIGLLDEHCPHRRASLVLGANEECGLRCLYHGWKFDVTGQCVDTPNEHNNPGLKNRVKITSYPVKEIAGMIWSYMGPVESQPVFPDFAWLGLPEGHVANFKVLEDCNYAQAMEGTIDSSHAGFLHRSVAFSMPAQFEFEADLSPKLEVEVTQYGLRYGALRDIEGQTNLRVTQVVLPTFSFIPPLKVGPHGERMLVNMFVPRDDYSTHNMQIFYDETRPVDVEFRIQEGGHHVDENFRKLDNIHNGYNQDRKSMQTGGPMSGIRGILVQDHAVSESQGRILDRTKEMLGTSDMTVVAWRRLMLKAVRALAEHGEVPSTLRSLFPWGDIRAENVSFPKGRKWKEEVPLAEAFVSAKAEAA